MLVDFARGNLLSKARQQPERVRDVLQKMRTDGIAATLDAVRSKLSQPMALGYCNVGEVTDVGAGVTGFKPGDRVVTNGKHAEIAVVPATLCARIPDGVGDDAAAFSVLGAIALQGVRLAEPTLGENFVVTGLGLIGLMAVQILKANGCRVLGIDTDPSRIAMARKFGAQTVDLSKGEDPVSAAAAFSRGRGVDGVLLTLSSPSSAPVSQAAKMCRKRGRVVLVGVTGLELNRADFYEKELSFQVSCSYGPGRYDPEFEEKGQDYPFGFVRWTEQRNFEAVLDMMASGALDASPLVTHRFSIDDAAKGYDVLASGEKSLGILIDYPKGGFPETAAKNATTVTIALRTAPPQGKGVTGVIGAGNYAGRVLIEAFRGAGADLQTLVSANGVSATHYGRKLSFKNAASDASAVFDDPLIDTVCIASRHDTHARFAQSALKAGKHVFVEKPLCLTLEELADIETAWSAAREAGKAPLVMVGFNRRFAPMVRKAKEILAASSDPVAMTMTVNAGAIPKEHWTQDAEQGGGRIVGEACHFIDLARHWAGAPVTSWSVAAAKTPGGPPLSDNVVITLSFANGSVAGINYFANGHKAHPKERYELFQGGRIMVLDNFRKLTAHGVKGFSGMSAWGQDKGQSACAQAFMAAVRDGKPAPIPAEELLEVSRLSIEIAQAAR
jgi:predicted dehydrogenase/threonine dehydrogenase-like Zn-dependent dehydrogenase